MFSQTRDTDQGGAGRTWFSSHHHLSLGLAQLPGTRGFDVTLQLHLHILMTRGLAHVSTTVYLAAHLLTPGTRAEVTVVSVDVLVVTGCWQLAFHLTFWRLHFLLSPARHRD